MGKSTYYFFFSIIITLFAGLYVLNATYYRFKGITLFGEKYKPGTQMYKSLQKNTSNKKILISFILFVIFTINLALTITKIINFDNKSYSSAILIYAPLSIILLAVITVRVNIQKLRSLDPKITAKTSFKKDANHKTKQK